MLILLSPVVTTCTYERLLEYAPFRTAFKSDVFHIISVELIKRWLKLYQEFNTQRVQIKCLKAKRCLKSGWDGGWNSLWNTKLSTGSVSYYRQKTVAKDSCLRFTEKERGCFPWFLASLQEYNGMGSCHIYFFYFYK